MTTTCVVCGERPVRYSSTQECTRCYQQRYHREGKLIRPPRVPRKKGPRTLWRETGTKLCPSCNRTLPIARFGMQKNRRYLKPYSYCNDCRTWKHHERAVLRSRANKKRGRNWKGRTTEEALQWVFEQHWERIA